MSGEFTNPAAGGPPYAEPPNTGPPNSEPKKRSLTALWIILAALVGAGAVILFLALSGSGAESDAQGPSDSPAPSAEAPAPSDDPAAEPTTEPTTEATTPPAAGVVFPATCEDLFTQSMYDEMPRLEINPQWTQEADVPTKYGTSDDGLIEVVERNKHLTCVWALPEGGGGAGMNTNVVQVDTTTAAEVVAKLEAMGQNCYDELGGLRCVKEVKHEEGFFGESHFLRDDIWLATLYGNMGPDGYTHHIIGNLWP